MSEKAEVSATLPPALPSASQLKFPLNAVPEATRPFLELIRIEKPTGTILIFWPFAWGLTMAAKGTRMRFNDYMIELLKCLIGAFIVRGSACTVNDIFDRHVDAGVDRTRGRPLPSGRISVWAATVFLIFQYTVGIMFFVLTVKNLPLWTALFQLFPLFMIYPFLKRYTHWPQAWLGFAMNFGFITAWTTSTNAINIPVNLTALAGCWCWTMLYDTIYACQDIKDDVKMGVRSTAILFGSWIRPLLAACGLFFLGFLCMSGVYNHSGYPYFVLSIGGTATHLISQYRTVNLDDPKSCWENFNRNGQLGWIIWSGMLVDYLRVVSVCK